MLVRMCVYISIHVQNTQEWGNELIQGKNSKFDFQKNQISSKKKYSIQYSSKLEERAVVLKKTRALDIADRTKKVQNNTKWYNIVTKQSVTMWSLKAGFSRIFFCGYETFQSIQHCGEIMFL